VRKKYLWIMWFFSILLLFSLSVAQESDQQLIDRINLHYRELGVFQAKYKQESETPALGGAQAMVFKDVSEGVLSFSKPDHIRLDQIQPRKEVLVSDGKTSWWYIPEENTAYKYTPRTQSGSLRALVEVLSGSGWLTDSFTVEVLKNREENLVKLKLMPRQQAEDFEFIEVGLTQGNLSLKTLYIAYLMGQRTHFYFSDVQEGASLSGVEFTFTPPPGTKISEGQ
jgi:outer membrane lipoprotein carrier protein